MAELRDWLTPHQQDLLADLSARQQLLNRWDGDRPIALLERCWLRLRILPISKLSAVLPPDNSGEAPELIRFRNLIQRASPALRPRNSAGKTSGKPPAPRPSNASGPPKTKGATAGRFRPTSTCSRATAAALRPRGQTRCPYWS